MFWSQGINDNKLNVKIVLQNQLKKDEICHGRDTDNTGEDSTVLVDKMKCENIKELLQKVRKFDN